MTSQLQNFYSEEFGSIRVINIDGEPWFVGRDVAGALGYANISRDINRHVDAEDRQVFQNYRNGTFEIPSRGLTIINESGLYSLILSSKLPTAKKFKRWVTSEILPSIRKHGAYATEDVLREAMNDPDFAYDLFCKLQAERDKNAALETYVEKLTPKARYYDLVLQTKNAVPISLIAKDYGMSATAFNKLLHGLGIQFKMGGTWVLYQKYANQRYTQSRTYYTGDIAVIHTYWTQKGRLFLYDTLAYCGIFPMNLGA